MLFNDILQLFEGAVTDLGHKLPAGTVVSEPPSHTPGDVSCNVAMLLAKSLQQSPRELAQELAEKLEKLEHIEEVEVAGPGFLNLKLSQSYYLQLASRLNAEDLSSALLLPESQRKKVSVEYVSANPSGPLHIGNARGGPLGEAISRVLQARGHAVTREFYVNNVGGQANRFAASVLHFYAGHFGQTCEFPEGGYQGDYVKTLAEELAKEDGGSLLHADASEWVELMRGKAIAKMVAATKKVVEKIGIHFDLWFSEEEMLKDGSVAKCLALLETRGATIAKDGAIWLKAGFQEDDRETVLVKSDTSTTYFMNDVAYHLDKLQKRANDVAVVLLGADHSGHPPRMRAAMEAVDLRADVYRAVVYQYVQLKKDGQLLDMSKRTGKFVSAAEVLEEVPRDVFIYFMVSKAHETHVDFDLQLAKDTSESNPVYSIQYAHARVASLLQKAAADGFELGNTEQEYSETEKRLLRHLGQFKAIVGEVSESYRINLICQYLQELAARYHQFYAHNRVIDKSSQATTSSRLTLSKLTKDTIKLGLELLSITAPDSLSREVAS
jgi:arginyl-tRNA synthetase